MGMAIGGASTRRYRTGAPVRRVVRTTGAAGIGPARFVPLSDLERERALEDGWRLAVRVALVSSVLVAALGAALVRFGGVEPVLVVALAATVALAIGVRLPAARPVRLAREHVGR